MYSPYRPGAIARSLLDRNCYGYGEDDEDIEAKKFYKLIF